MAEVDPERPSPARRTPTSRATYERDLRRYRTLRRMLQVAIDEQKIVANPCDRVTPPRVPKKEMVFLDWAQVIELSTAHKQRFQSLILFAVETGMRWSELVGPLDLAVVGSRGGHARPRA